MVRRTKKPSELLGFWWKGWSGEINVEGELGWRQTLQGLVIFSDDVQTVNTHCEEDFEAQK